MQKLKKILKIFFISILILIFVAENIVLLGIGFSFFFGDKVEEIILNKINSNLKNELSLSEVEFSVFKNFPYASVTLENILIPESFQNSSDTLIFAKEGIIKLNILDVIYENYSIQNITFDKAVIKIKYNNNGEANFNILKDNTKENNNFELSNLGIINSKVTFSDQSEKIEASSKIENINLFLKKEDEKIICDLNGSLKLQFSNKSKEIYTSSDIENINLFLEKEEKKIICDINASLHNEFLVVNEEDYINDKAVSFNSKIKINPDSILITAQDLSIGGVDFKNLNFNYFDSGYLLTTETENADISNVIFATPQEYQYLYEDHEMSGEISANILIKKEKEFTNPYSKIDFKLNNAKYKSKTQPFELENISSDSCCFDNGNERNFASTKFRFSNFTSSKKDGYFNGDFTLTNLNEYYLNAEMFSSWELSELNDFIDDSPFKNLKGTVSGNINYQGNLSFDSKMSSYFVNSKHKGDLNFKNVYFNYEESKLDFVFDKMNWKVDNHDITISKNDFRVSQSELSFDGNIDNLIPYILDEKDKIDINNGTLSSDKMIFEELFTITEINDDDEGEEIGELSILPMWLDVNISVNVKKFWYNNFSSSDLTGNVKYNSEKLELTGEEIDMQTLGGRISGDAIYRENKLNHLILKSNLKLNKINIADGFKSFDNFKQTFITNKNIKGSATANIYLQAMWDKDYKFFSPSLRVSSDLKIENGELIEFEPLYDLSNYVSLEELKEVQFATLENTIRIENDTIKIPAMDIHSTALSLHIKGDHTFDNMMHYQVRLLLSDILGNKVKKSMNLDEIENNQDGRTTIQLIMSGHVDDPKISLDKLKLKEDIGKELKKEGEKVITIIENKISNKETPDEEEKKEELEIELEWDDEN